MAEEFRTFPMEHLAGEESTVVRLKEHQCLFEWLDVDLRARGGHTEIDRRMFISVYMIFIRIYI